MLADLAATFPQIAQRFGAASEVLGFDLWDLVQSGPEEELNATANTQPVLLAADVALWDVWRELGGRRPDYVAGHSFGEYAALVCADAIEFEEGIALVADRGRFIQDAVPTGEGAMAAIMGGELAALETICTEVSSTHGVCECANLNAPDQVVIAGTRAAIDAACAMALERGAKRAVPLTVSAPIHCALMRPAAERLAERLSRVRLGRPSIAVLHNVDATTHDEPDAIREALIRQVHSPVRWRETIESLADRGVTKLCECGPGKVLTALVRRIDRQLSCAPLQDEESLREAVASYAVAEA